MVIIDNDWFALDGVSCETVGLSCDTPPVQIMANRSGYSYDVAADETMYVDDDAFSDITFKFTCHAFLPDSFDTSAIYAYLQGKNTLTMSRNSGYFYKIRNITCTPKQKYDGRRIDYSINIQCAPFKYHISDDAVTHTGTGDTFTVQNDGTRYCKPVYTFTLSSLTGLGGFIVNGQGVVISLPQAGISSTNFVIDTERMVAYYGTDNLANAMMYTAGAFPFLASGTNFMVLNGIISSVSIKRNQRSY